MVSCGPAPIHYSLILHSFSPLSRSLDMTHCRNSIISWLGALRPSSSSELSSLSECEFEAACFTPLAARPTYLTKSSLKVRAKYTFKIFLRRLMALHCYRCLTTHAQTKIRVLVASFSHDLDY